MIQKAHHPQVGVPGGRGNDPTKLIHRGVDIVEAPGTAAGHDLLNGRDNVLIAASTQDTVHLGKLLGDLLLVALGHAA